MGCHVERAESNGHVERLWFHAGGRVFSEEVDLAAIAWGLHPNTELDVLLGCKVEGAVATDDFQLSSQPDIYCAGEATGIGGLDVASLEGAIAGCVVVGDESAALK